MSITNTYFPDYAIHPGEILEETLLARQMKKTDLAERAELSLKTVSLIINGKEQISADTAIKFERVLGVSASIWSNVDANYKLFVARSRSRVSSAVATDWISKFPIKELKKLNVLPNTKNSIEIAEGLLHFFGVANIPAYNEVFTYALSAHYRHSTSYMSNLESLASWLRLSEVKAEAIQTSPFDKDLLIKNINTVKSFLDKPIEKVINNLIELYRQSGIAIVITPELEDTHICGASKWLSKDKAMLSLSLRFKKDDHFWFNFFHETAHILLHSKKMTFIDIEPSVSSKSLLTETNSEEDEANSYARKILISDLLYNEFTQNKNITKLNIITFSKKHHIAPSILVGRLQYDNLLNHSYCNDLKKTITYEMISEAIN